MEFTPTVNGEVGGNLTQLQRLEQGLQGGQELDEVIRVKAP